jgi:type 1 glutamine amidotransferase
VWTRVADNFNDVEAINQSKLLITYTCDYCPSIEEQQGLRRFLDGGGRWIALHGTNALIEFVDGKADTPDKAPDFMQMLGSRFVAHPAVQKFNVRVAASEHPLVAGIEDFEVEDEPYYCEFFDNNEVLLEASYDVPSTGYVRSDFGTDQPSHPQMYVHTEGRGQVLYMTLGHCCGKYDLRPLADVVPIARGAWELPVYYELLRRSIRWGIGVNI